MLNSETDPPYPHKGGALETTRGEVRVSFYLPAPESTSSECGFQSQPALLGSNPVTSATLDSLLTFLCLRVSIYE